jgi:hypothetical protein
VCFQWPGCLSKNPWVRGKKRNPEALQPRDLSWRVCNWARPPFANTRSLFCGSIVPCPLCCDWLPGASASTKNANSSRNNAQPRRIIRNGARLEPRSFRLIHDLHATRREYRPASTVLVHPAETLYTLLTRNFNKRSKGRKHANWTVSHDITPQPPFFSTRTSVVPSSTSPPQLRLHNYVLLTAGAPARNRDNGVPSTSSVLSSVISSLRSLAIALSAQPGAGPISTLSLT